MKSISMTNEQKVILITAWNWCDQKDKSTEFMLQYMSDMAQVNYDDVVEFVMQYERTEEDFKL